MRYRSTIIYLIAAVILSGIYFYETRSEKEAEKIKEKFRLLVQLQHDQPDTITLKKENQLIRLVKSGTTEDQKWEITSPIHAETDKVIINRLNDALIKLKYTRIILDKTDDLTQFGLDKPVFIISYAAGGVKNFFSFGHKSPVEDGFYVIKGETKKVYLIKSADKEALDKGIFDLRDKTLFSLEADEVTRITIDRESGRWLLNKKDDRWIFGEDKDLKIDRTKIESLIRRTLWLEAASFEKETADDLKPFGLDKPSARIFLSDGRKSEEIIFGNDLKDDQKGRIYAWMRSKPLILTVEKKVLENLPANIDEIKEKGKMKDTK